MEHTIGAFDARRKFGKVLDEVVAKQDRYVVERHGQAVAAVVPIHIYEQWKQARETFFARMEAIGQQVHLPEDEAQALVEEAKHAVRTEQADGS